MIEFFKYTTEGFTDRASLAYNASYDDAVGIFVMQFDDAFWFESELQGLDILSEKPYRPDVIDIDTVNLTIEIDWGKSLNHMIHEGTAPTTWKDDVNAIIKDLEASSIYKLNLFNHTFFYDRNNTLKLIDCYGCLDGSAKVQFDDLAAVLTTTSKDRFAPFIDSEGNLKIKEIYDATKMVNVGNWPDNFLND